jgi:hypothetical protein
MKTEDLISLLVSDLEPVRPRRVRARFIATLAGAMAVLLVLAVGLLGVRPDFVAATHAPLFWWKLLYPGILALCGSAALARLGHPGMKLGAISWVVAIMLTACWVPSAFILLTSPPGERLSLVEGKSAFECAATILALAVPAAVAAFLAERRLAPTRPSHAGAAAGLFAGGCAVLAYALHCTEMQLPFVAVWYTAGILIPAAIGALVGSELLRW